MNTISSTRRLRDVVPISRGLSRSAALYSLLAALASSPTLFAQAAPQPAEPVTKAAQEEKSVAAAVGAGSKVDDKKITDTPPTDGVQRLDKLEVVDKRVEVFSGRNVDLPRGIDDVQPYYLFTGASIERSGAVNLENYLQRNLTMNTAAYSQNQSFFIGGNPSSVSLRGLGSGQTLILINGRRSFGSNLALNGGSSQPDINGIPLGAIDRIEVLPTTASAIYGSNAVGGVINIVLKRDYSGGEIKSTYQNTFDTDAPIRRVDTNYGLAFNHGKTHLNFTASYMDEKGLKVQDRYDPLVVYNLRAYNNAAASYFGYGYVGTTPNIVASPSTSNLTLKNGTSLNSPITYISPGISPTTSTADLYANLLANSGQRNLDTAANNYIRGLGADIGTPSRNKSFGVNLRHEVTSNLEVEVAFSLSSAIATRNMTITGSQSVPATAPTNPFTTAVTVYLPLPGDWPVWSDNVKRQITTGFVYKLPFNWKAQADYTWSNGTNSYYALYAFATADITAALNAGTLNPFLDTTKYPFDLRPYAGTMSWTGSGGTNDVALRLSGPVWHLPGGDPTLTIGLENRLEGYGDGKQYTVYPNYPARNAITQSLGKSQRTQSAYGEVQVPVFSRPNARRFLQQLDFQFAARTEKFRVGTGTSSITLLPVPTTAPTILSNKAYYQSTNPTAGLRYSPVRGVIFRASVAKGFVAPSYSQLLYNPTPSTTLTNIIDPRRGGTGYGVTTYSGGNPELTPERSKSYNAGLVLEPTWEQLKGLRLDVEYFVIRKQNNIGTITAQQTVDNESLFPDRVVRAAAASGDPYGVGQISSVNISSMNLLKTFVEGYDVNLSYRRPTDRFGTFELSGLATFNNHNKRKTTYGQPYYEYAGFTGYALKFQGNATLTWEYRRFTAGWTTRYYPKLKLYGPPLTTSTTTWQQNGGSPYVPSQAYSDVFVSYRFPGRGHGVSNKAWRDRLVRDTEIQLGVNNVLKQIPPFDPGSFGSYPYSTYGDLRLREYRISIKKAL